MTLDAIDWLYTIDEVSLMPGSTGYMFGIDRFDDGPCAMDYDPWEHAELLGLPLITRADLPTSQMVACYSSKRKAVFVRPGLSHAVERCAIAHEIVHHEWADIGTTRAQEDRADRLAARRLIRPTRMREIGRVAEDLGRIALELNVTERIMRTFMRNHG